jgi:hypothetical protein
MAAPLQDPRFQSPTPATATYQELARAIRHHEEAIAKALIGMHRKVWPADRDIRYVITQKDGAVKVRFEPPEVREPGFRE